MKPVLKSLVAIILSMLPVPCMALDYADMDTKEQQFLKNYVLGNVRFVLLHEVGHMLVDQYKLPVLGREEDAVDAFSTVVMLESHSKTMDMDIAYAAQEWLNGARRDIAPLEEQYADVHSLSKQRAFNIACMMIGKDYEKFEGLAQLIGYPSNSTGGCYGRYRETLRAWMSLLSPHVNEDEPSRIVISNDEVSSEQAEGMALSQKWMRDSHALSDVSAMVADLFKLDINLRIEAVYCATDSSTDSNQASNAFWIADQSTIRFCYELGASYFDHAVSIIQAERAKTAWLK